jgi:hypothetical protein
MGIPALFGGSRVIIAATGDPWAEPCVAAGGDPRGAAPSGE